MAGPTLGSLFEPPPERWGLRGDPGLCAELARRLDATPLPDSFADLWRLLEAAYAETTGQPLTCPEFRNIERFDRGGMSAGMVHPETWAQTLFPLVSRRYGETRYGRAPDPQGPGTT